jgi:hypothetical protein
MTAASSSASLAPRQRWMPDPNTKPGDAEDPRRSACGAVCGAEDWRSCPDGEVTWLPLSSRRISDPALIRAPPRVVSCAATRRQVGTDDSVASTCLTTDLEPASDAASSQPPAADPSRRRNRAVLINCVVVSCPAISRK